MKALTIPEMTLRKSRRFGIFKSMLLLLVVITALNYAEHGRLAWPRDVLLSASTYTASVADWLQQLAGKEPSTPTDIISTTELVEPTLRGLVVKVTDGDTFTLRNNAAQEEIIRLHGIDAPEWEQPHGRAAATALSQRIANRQVSIQVQDTDNYGRLVGTVYLDDENINLSMVSEGHAWWYEYYARDDATLEQAQTTARSSGRGLWAGSAPQAPWDWRRSH